MNVATITIKVRAKFYLPTCCGLSAVATKTRDKIKYPRCHRIVIYILQSCYLKKLDIFHRSITIQYFEIFSPRLASSRPLHVVSNSSKL
jgi:hypothetical protein